MNPTTLQKVLELLGADLGDGKARLRRLKVPVVFGGVWLREDWHDALIIAEIEEALEEDGFMVFQKTNQGDGTWCISVTDYIEAFCGIAPTKLAAWCDLFLKYKGVQDD